MPFTLVNNDTSGGRFRRAVVTATGPASYATGGEAGLKGVVGFTEINHISATPANVATQDYGLVWVESTGKAIYSTEGAQVANATDLSALAWTIEVVGI